MAHGAGGRVRAARPTQRLPSNEGSNSSSVHACAFSVTLHPGCILFQVDGSGEGLHAYLMRTERGGTMKILLAYDGFEYSRHALEEAARMAAEEDSTVTVVSVVPPDAHGAKSGGHVGLPPHAEEDIARANAFLAEHGIEAETKIRNGDPADELIAEATEGRYDIAVAGSRGLGPVGQLLHGSVSRNLVKRMPCSVIVAGPEKTERYEPEAATR